MKIAIVLSIVHVCYASEWFWPSDMSNTSDTTVPHTQSYHRFSPTNGSVLDIVGKIPIYTNVVAIYSDVDDVDDRKRFRSTIDIYQQYEAKVKHVFLIPFQTEDDIRALLLEQRVNSDILAFQIPPEESLRPKTYLKTQLLPLLSVQTKRVVFAMDKEDTEFDSYVRRFTEVPSLVIYTTSIANAWPIRQQTRKVCQSMYTSISNHYMIDVSTLAIVGERKRLSEAVMKEDGYFRDITISSGGNMTWLNVLTEGVRADVEYIAMTESGNCINVERVLEAIKFHTRDHPDKALYLESENNEHAFVVSIDLAKEIVKDWNKYMLLDYSTRSSLHKAVYETTKMKDIQVNVDKVAKLHVSVYTNP